MITGGWRIPEGPPLPPGRQAAMAAGHREQVTARSAPGPLAARAWQAIRTSRKPLTAADLQDRARITRGHALALLRDWEQAGQVTALPSAGPPAPYLTRYATPDQATQLAPAAPPEVEETPMPAAPALPTEPSATPHSPSALAANMLAAALAYAGRGWHVFPLRPGDKRPAFPNHPEHRCAGTDPRCRVAGRHIGWEDRATTDPERIERAWHPASSRPPYGIGIACGPSGLAVVDLDTPKPGQAPPPEWALPGVLDGGDVLAVLAHRAGQRLPIGDTHSVATASGGTHLYFTAPPPGEAGPLRNTAGRLGWLIDTRAGGGYVVAPPTVITRDDGTTAAYEMAVHAPAAPLPPWLAQTLTPPPLPAQTPVQAVLRATGDRRRDAYLASAVRRQLTTITTAGEGGRNAALYRSAVALGQLVAGGELDSDGVAGWLETTALAAGLTPAETARTIRSGMHDGAGRPRTLAATPASEGAAA